jgi:hypothetical protein
LFKGLPDIKVVHIFGTLEPRSMQIFQCRDS